MHLVQGKSDVFRIYALAQRDGADFNLAGIPVTFTETSKEAFDRDDMRVLFQVGFEQARRGYPGMKAPPDLARQR